MTTPENESRPESGPEKELEKLKEELKEYKDKYLRQLAETENMRIAAILASRDARDLQSRVATSWDHSRNGSAALKSAAKSTYCRRRR